MRRFETCSGAVNTKYLSWKPAVITFWYFYMYLHWQSTLAGTATVAKITTAMAAG